MTNIRRLLLYARCINKSQCEKHPTYKEKIKYEIIRNKYYQKDKIILDTAINIKY